MLDQLKKEFASGRRFLVVGNSQGDVRLETRDGMVYDEPTLVMDLQRALVNFEKVAGHGTELYGYQMQMIAGCSASLIDKWLSEGVLIASISPPSGMGRHRQRLFSLSDAFVCGVVGSLRRMGVTTVGLKAVADYLRRGVPVVVKS